MAKMMELKNSLPENALVERESLWHGTKSDCVASIVSLGFNRSYSRQEGKWHGHTTAMLTLAQFEKDRGFDYSSRAETFSAPTNGQMPRFQPPSSLLEKRARTGLSSEEDRAQRPRYQSVQKLEKSVN